MADLNRRTTERTTIARMANMILADDYAGDEFVLQQELCSLQRHFERFSGAHDGLVAAAQPTELDAHLELWDALEGLYNQAVVKLHRLSALTGAPSESDGTETMRTAVMNMKLDPVSVPTFDGSLRNWLAFKDTFETLVHDRECPEAYKLAKLRSAVKGDAVERLVGGMYSGGYEDVWKALKARFDNPKQLAEIHVSRFIGLKPVQGETTSSLLMIVDTVRESLRALAVMKLPVDKWDALAVPIVTSKLPASTQQAWGMSLSTNDIPTLEQLLTFVEKRAHSFTTDVLHWPSTTSSTPSYGTRRNPSGVTASSRLVKSNLVASSPGGCNFCSETSHRISRCPTLVALPVSDRFNKLKGSNLCFNCLQPGHATKQCQGGNCRTCNGKHHTLLCRGSSNPTNASGASGQQINHSSVAAAPAGGTDMSTRPPQNYSS